MSAIEFWVSLQREISPASHEAIMESIHAKMWEMSGRESSAAWIYEARAFIGEAYKDYYPRVVTQGFDDELGSIVDLIAVNVEFASTDTDN